MTNRMRFNINYHWILISLGILFFGFLSSPIASHAKNSAINMEDDANNIYQIMKTECGRIAVGEKSSAITRKMTDFFEKDTYTYEELGIDTKKMSQDAINSKVKEILRIRLKDRIEQALDRMKIDSPYELYWFDRKSTVQITFSYVKNSHSIFFEEADDVIITMNVAKDYQDNGISLKIHPNVIARAKAAKENALSIVNKYDNASDREKIMAYAKEIQSRTFYDEEAVTTTYLSRYGYGDPYQLISVFDNDSSTGTVCEGYAKAFQYLCELSHFTDARSYIVTGSLNSNNINGSHMWNLVKMNGQTYIVDVTNASLPEGDLILTGAVSLGSQQYLVLDKDKQKVFYTYDGETSNLYSSSLLRLVHRHIEGNAVMKNRIEATCTTPVSYDTVTYCQYCHEELSRETYRGTVGEHVFKNTTVTRTCLKDGYKLHECLRCGYTYKNSIIPAYGRHTYNSGTQNANTTITYTCLRCQEKKTEGKPVTVAKAKSASPANPTTSTSATTKAKTPTTSTSAVKDKGVKNKVLKITIQGKASVKVGKALTLKAQVKTSTGKAVKVTWKIDKKKYAKINSKGKLTALKAGKGKKVKITAMAADGSGKKATKVIKIKK